MQPTYEVADVLQRNIGSIPCWVQNSWKLRTLNALAVCRTQALGGHVDICTNPECRKVHISYNSCRNRHCPKCQGNKREEWIQAREKELVKAPYYHVVFTLPCEVNPLCLYRPADVYNLLFKIAWLVIRDFAGNAKFLGAKTGMIAILHTWGQNLSLHPHLHCIVPGGGITPSNKWKPARGKSKYLFPVKAMSQVFRARFVKELRKEFTLESGLYKSLFQRPWVVYCKQPFRGPEQVIEYLGRYTHKIAISNHRIQGLENQSVRFTAKDYRKGGARYELTLTDQEFIRRFCLHILPRGFTRIRHYGILSSSLKKVCISLLHEELGKPEVHNIESARIGKCFACGKGALITLVNFDSRGPPSAKILKTLVNEHFNKLPK